MQNASTSGAASDPTGTAAMVGSAAESEIETAESKAEEYALTHLFGATRGEAFYQVLTGNQTVQTAVTAQNVKAVSFLEKLYMKYVEPTLYSAFSKAGLV